jgi:hypothetical protein
MLCVDEDLDRARDLARPWLTVYLGGMGAKGKNFYVDAAERFGEGDAARGPAPLHGGRPRGRGGRVDARAHRPLGGVLPSA